MRRERRNPSRRQEAGTLEPGAPRPGPGCFPGVPFHDGDGKAPCAWSCRAPGGPALSFACHRVAAPAAGGCRQDLDQRERGSRSRETGISRIRLQAKAGADLAPCRTAPGGSRRAIPGISPCGSTALASSQIRGMGRPDTRRRGEVTRSSKPPRLHRRTGARGRRAQPVAWSSNR